MPALPYPTYGISNLYLFPFFQTREAYFKATGKEAPAYDPTKPVKCWFDPKAADSTARRIVYDRVLAIADNGMPLVGSDGKPFLEPMVLDKAVAANVNIAPKGPELLDQPATGTEIPCPVRALEPGEELYLQFGGTVAVRNKALWNSDIEVGFKGSDRALLQAIAEKLGIGL